MLYGVSLRYKESANCRMEANYAHQQELDMIPLLMQEDYKPQGWRESQYWCQVLRLLVQRHRQTIDTGYCAGSGPDHGHEAVVCHVGCREG